MPIRAKGEWENDLPSERAGEAGQLETTTTMVVVITKVDIDTERPYPYSTSYLF
jgi:hypothetical protein